jgi:hypothetical protein
VIGKQNGPTPRGEDPKDSGSGQAPPFSAAAPTRIVDARGQERPRRPP